MYLGYYWFCIISNLSILMGNQYLREHKVNFTCILFVTVSSGHFEIFAFLTLYSYHFSAVQFPCFSLTIAQTWDPDVLPLVRNFLLSWQFPDMLLLMIARL